MGESDGRWNISDVSEVWFAEEREEAKTGTSLFKRGQHGSGLWMNEVLLLPFSGAGEDKSLPLKPRVIVL